MNAWKQTETEDTLDDWNREATMNLLRKKLESGTQDIELGYNVIGRQAAWDYLDYLEDGGNLTIEAYMRFEKPSQENMKRFFDSRFA